MTPGRRATVLGGGGFVGSAIVKSLASAGWTVEVIDSIEPRTFGRAERLDGIAGVTLDRRDVTEIADLAERLARQDLVVDAMGWTRHRDAERSPEIDLKLNLTIHVHLLQRLRPGPLFVWLGSRHQFAGRSGVIDDATPFAPLDVQGIHKCAAEQHVQHWTRHSGGRAVALRIGNCAGPGQPADNGDVGLIGGFLRDLRRGETISVFDGPRVRNVCFTPDVGAVITGIADLRIDGFVPVNMPGIEVAVADLAQELHFATGRGAVRREQMPDEIARTELSAGSFTGPTLGALLPAFSPVLLRPAIAATVAGS